jgi:hypothetical protein
MSWGIEIPEVYLSRVKIDELEDYRDAAEESIQEAKEHILVHMAAYPRDFKDEFNNDWTWENHIQVELNIIWMDLKDDIIRKYLCTLAIEDIDHIKEI